MIQRGNRRSFLQNTGALFGAQAVSMLVPLVTVPYLARVLRPEGWSSVILAQALGAWVVLLLEFGFDLSGARAVAQARSAPATMPLVISGVQGARLLLLPAAAAIVGLAFVLLPSLRTQGVMLAWTLAFAIARGLNPLWFFQGIERVRMAVAVDATSKIVAALGVFVVVASPADGWRVIALQAVCAAVSLVVLTWRMMRMVPHVRPTWPASLATLRGASSVFGVRAASGLYNQANALILSTLSSAATVAFFGGAERIVRASINLLQPLTQAFLPRLSFLSVANPKRGLRVIELCLMAMAALGGLFGLSAFVGAPLLTRILLGPGYESAVPVLRALAPLPVLVAIDTVLGLYWAVPFGHERAFLYVVLGAGVTNIVLAFLLVPRWGALGMALAVVAAEAVVTLSLSVLFLRMRNDGQRPPASVEP